MVGAPCPRPIGRPFYLHLIGGAGGEALPKELSLSPSIVNASPSGAPFKISVERDTRLPLSTLRRAAHDLSHKKTTVPYDRHPQPQGRAEQDEGEKE